MWTVWRGVSFRWQKHRTIHSSSSKKLKEAWMPTNSTWERVVTRYNILCIYIYCIYIVFVYNDYTKTFINIKTQLRLFILLKLVKFDKSFNLNYNYWCQFSYNKFNNLFQDNYILQDNINQICGKYFTTKGMYPMESPEKEVHS